MGQLINKDFVLFCACMRCFFRQLFCRFLSFVFLGLRPQHMEVPRLAVQSELLLPAYARATATPDPSCACKLHHTSQQRRILNPLRETRDQTRNLMVPSQIHFYCTMTGTLRQLFKICKFCDFFHFLNLYPLSHIFVYL